MRLIMFVIAFTTFFISSSVSAKDYFFMSDGQEVEVVFTGPISNPNTVTFYAPCNSQNCDMNITSQVFHENFIEAVASDNIYYWKNAGVGSAGTVSASKQEVFVRMLNDNDVSDIGSAVKIVGKGVPDTYCAITDENVCQLIDKASFDAINHELSAKAADDANQAFSNVLFGFLAHKDGIPHNYCTVKEPGRCEQTDALSFDQSNGQVVAVMANVDFQNITQRRISAQLTEVMFRKRPQCDMSYAGVSGNQTATITCS